MQKDFRASQKCVSYEFIPQRRNISYLKRKKKKKKYHRDMLGLNIDLPGLM